MKKIILNYTKELEPAEAIKLLGMNKLLNAMDPGTIGKMAADNLHFDKIDICFLKEYLKRSAEDLYIWK